MYSINLKSMLENVGDLEKIAKALTPAEAVRQVEEESTPKGNAAHSAKKGAIIGAIAGTLHGSMKPGSGKMKALKGLYHAGAAGMWLGGAAGAAGYAKRKLIERTDESKEKALGKLLKEASLNRSLGDFLNEPTSFTSGSGKTYGASGMTRKSVKRTAPRKNNFTHLHSNTTNAGAFGGKVMVKPGSVLSKNVGEAAGDGVRKVVGTLAKLFRGVK